MTLAGIQLSGALGDVVYVLGVIAFFAICVGLVKACEWIIGRDESVLDAADGSASHHEDVAA